MVYAIVLLATVSFFTVCIQLLSWTEGLNEFFTDKVLFDNVFWSTVVRSDVGQPCLQSYTTVALSGDN